MFKIKKEVNWVYWSSSREFCDEPLLNWLISHFFIILSGFTSVQSWLSCHEDVVQPRAPLKAGGVSLISYVMSSHVSITLPVASPKKPLFFLMTLDQITQWDGRQKRSTFAPHLKIPNSTMYLLGVASPFCWNNFKRELGPKRRINSMWQVRLNPTCLGSNPDVTGCCVLG